MKIHSVGECHFGQHCLRLRGLFLLCSRIHRLFRHSFANNVVSNDRRAHLLKVFVSTGMIPVNVSIQQKPDLAGVDIFYRGSDLI